MRLFRRLLIVVALAAIVLPGASQAVPDPGPVVIGGPGSWLTPTYTTPAVVVPVGGPLTYVHADAQRHNVEANNAYLPIGQDEEEWCIAYPLGRCPIFWSPVIGLPTTDVPVRGLDNLVSGQVYTFTCLLHPGMIGQLLAV